MKPNQTRRYNDQMYLMITMKMTVQINHCIIMDRSKMENRLHKILMVIS